MLKLTGLVCIKNFNYPSTQTQSFYSMCGKHMVHGPNVSACAFEIAFENANITGLSEIIF